MDTPTTGNTEEQIQQNLAQKSKSIALIIVNIVLGVLCLPIYFFMFVIAAAAADRSSDLGFIAVLLVLLGVVAIASFVVSLVHYGNGRYKRAFIASIVSIVVAFLPLIPFIVVNN